MTVESMAELARELHANSKIEEVALSRLQTDYTYQRDTSEKMVDEIANNWDVVASELILVSNRGTRPAGGDVKGGLFIVNGQHRSKAAMKRGLEKIEARVIDLRKVEDPASVEALFRLKTNVRLGDRPLERFKAQLRANDPESISIRDMLERFGTEINVQPNSETGINCVSTIEAIYRLDDGALLKDVLETVKDAYPYVGGRYTQSPFLKGLAWFIAKHATESDRTRLISKLQGIGTAVLSQRARTMKLTMGGSLWVNYYRALVDLYNESLRDKSRLQFKLRGKLALDRSGGGVADHE